MASQNSKLTFGLFAAGMILLTCGLLLVPNQLFGDDPISLPPVPLPTDDPTQAPAAPPAAPPVVTCAKCDLDQTTPCCIYDPMLNFGFGGCKNSLAGAKCKGQAPFVPGIDACSAKFVPGIMCTTCGCSSNGLFTLKCSCQ